MRDLLDAPLVGSAETWSDAPAAPRIPPELIPPGTGSMVARLRLLRQRHLLRGRRADEVFAESLDPERALPVADRRSVLGFVGGLLRESRWLVIALVALHALAAVAGLVVPRILGDLVNRVQGEGGTRATVDALALAVGAVVVLQALLTFGALAVSTVFGYGVLARAREYIVRTVLALPLGRVESSSSGDLVTRVTRDVSTMSQSIRFGIPEVIIGLMVTVLTVVAMLLNSVILTVPLLVMAPLVIFASRRYFARAPQGYIAEGATYSLINSTLTETVEGARTVEALRLEEQRTAAGDGDIAVSAQAERYTMVLRNLLFALLGFVYDTPVVGVLILGGYAYARGWVDLGQITAASLYVQSVVEPIQRLIRNLDRLQVGIASTSRLLGIASVPADREEGDARPDGNRLVARDLRFAYREGHDVLHGVSVDLVPGERLAIVGPSGSGKSTLGRLLAGINTPRTGSVSVGEVELTTLPLELLRTEVALVTQEHHVFVGTIRDNIILAREDSPDSVVIEALRTVEAWDWVARLPDRLDTMLGAGNLKLTPAQAQQIALARLVVADPHTLVLDEATSLIDPRTARHLEGSMGALLLDRSVVAIAHRLHTAHDADRIAVVIDGRIAELGSHDELIAAEGEYARLWKAWTS